MAEQGVSGLWLRTQERAVEDLEDGIRYLETRVKALEEEVLLPKGPRGSAKQIRERLSELRTLAASLRDGLHPGGNGRPELKEGVDEELAGEVKAARDAADSPQDSDA